MRKIAWNQQSPEESPAFVPAESERSPLLHVGCAARLTGVTFDGRQMEKGNVGINPCVPADAAA